MQKKSFDFGVFKRDASACLNKVEEQVLEVSSCRLKHSARSYWELQVWCSVSCHIINFKSSMNRQVSAIHHAAKQEKMHKRKLSARNA